MSRFYIKREFIKDGKIYITGEEAHHALDVMRLKKGDSIVTFDGAGKEYIGVIANTSKDNIVVNILETKNKETKSNIDLTLAITFRKGNGFQTPCYLTFPNMNQGRHRHLF